MKAVELIAFGRPEESVRCAEVADPGPPGPGEVVVDIEAFPINPADLLTVEGRYAVRPDLPARLGAEGVGRISAFGEGVSGLDVGQRVINLARENWTERRRVGADEVVPVPGDVDLLQLAMLKVNPPTAYYMLTRFVDLAPGDWVVQNAGNSAVGQHVIRLARAHGWRTVNVVRRESLIAPLQAIGADVVLVDGEDLGERLLAATGGTPARLAIDAVGGDAMIRLADGLADGGTIVNYGLLSGDCCKLTSHQVVFRGITLKGFWLMPHLQAASAQEKADLFAELAGLIASGDLQAEVEAHYPIERIREAVAHAGREGRDGKILVTTKYAVNGPD